MNVGNYGNTLFFGTGFNGAGFDMSSYTNLILTFTAPDGVTTFTVQLPAVSLGIVNQIVRGGTFNANQYVAYSFLPGQITQAGKWQVRLTYVQASATPPINFTSEIAYFVVGK